MRNNSDGEETKIERKASSPDRILNEMIKYTSHKFSNTISKRFNLIVRVGHSPDIWSKWVITPIFKSGNKFDPNNY